MFIKYSLAELSWNILFTKTFYELKRLFFLLVLCWHQIQQLMLLFNPSHTAASWELVHNLNLGWLDGWLVGLLQINTHWHYLASCLPTFEHVFQNKTDRLRAQNFYPHICPNSLPFQRYFTPSDPCVPCVNKLQPERDDLLVHQLLKAFTAFQQALRRTSKQGEDPPLLDKRNWFSPLKITCLVRVGCSPPTSTHTNVW